MSSSNDSDSSPAFSLLAWLQLLRAPNVFSALADIAGGFLLAQQSFQPPITLVLLAVASAAMYMAGMVLNDVYDADIDADERPGRPIPSGRISLGLARQAGWGLLLFGVAVAWVAGIWPASEAALPWRPGAIATLIAAAVWLYDGVLKSTPAGPFVMGMCRTLNLLLGMSAATALPSEGQFLLLGYGADHLLLAGGMGLYIAGVTWFSRQEAFDSEDIDRLQLGVGIGLMALGLAVAGSFASFRSTVPGLAEPTFGGQGQSMWWTMLLVLGLTVVGRCGAALGNPTGELVRQAVVQCLRSYIIFIAALALACAPPGYAFAILLLLAPAMLLGYWVYST